MRYFGLQVLILATVGFQIRQSKKYLKDGKFVIIKGGKEYDAAGAVK